AAGQLGDQLGGTVRRRDHAVRIDAALEPVGGGGRQRDALGGAADAGGTEVRRLQEQVRCLRRHLCLSAAHDTGDGDGAIRVGDHQHVGGKGDLGAVDGGDRLAGAGSADDDAALVEGGEVEG